MLWLLGPHEVTIGARVLGGSRTRVEAVADTPAAGRRGMQVRLPDGVDGPWLRWTISTDPTMQSRVVVVSRLRRAGRCCPSPYAEHIELRGHEPSRGGRGIRVACRSRSEPPALRELRVVPRPPARRAATRRRRPDGLAVVRNHRRRPMLPPGSRWIRARGSRRTSLPVCAVDGTIPADGRASRTRSAIDGVVAVPARASRRHGVVTSSRCSVHGGRRTSRPSSGTSFAAAATSCAGSTATFATPTCLMVASGTWLLGLADLRCIPAQRGCHRDDRARASGRGGSDSARRRSRLVLSRTG